MSEYVVKETIPESARTALSKYPTLLSHLLYTRGVTNEGEAERFLHPDYKRDSYDPFLLSGMESAVSRVKKSIKENEKVVIYSDYDHDGIPGGVTLYETLKTAGYSNVTVYIPHRNREGFSLNIPAVERFAKNKVGLIITVDCGITNVTEVNRANELGIDVIITDHHRPKDKVPSAYTILNPNSEGDTYPFKGLCGAGVVLKLVQALVERGVIDVDVTKDGLLDLIAIATLSDMVPLVNENRMIARLGLEQLHKSTRPGLKSLFKIARIDQGHLSEDDVVFMIAPRINAASRMDVSDVAFKLLSSSDEEEAEETAKHLNEINDKRKARVASIVKTARKRLDARSELPPVVVVGDMQWELGLAGLVGQAIAKHYHKTVFVWGCSEETSEIKGSCRSVNGVDVVSLMDTLPKGTLIDHGGHTASGGFSTHKEEVYYLEEKLNEAHKYSAVDEKKREPLSVDGTLTLEDVNWETYALLERLAPFGMGNPKPLFLFKDIKVTGVKEFGKQKEHLELEFNKVSAICFFKSLDDFDVSLEKGARVSLFAHIEKSVFRGSPELRLRIVDISL